MRPIPRILWKESKTLNLNQMKSLHLMMSQLCSLASLLMRHFKKVTRKCLENNTSLKERTTWTIDQILGVQVCLEAAYFSSGGCFCRQLHGCSVGGPVSPILASLVMEHFGVHALESCWGAPPRVWLRCVDDTYVVIQQREQDYFFEHIDGISCHIEFAQEGCSSSGLAFLDCNIEVDNERGLTTAVCCGPARAGRCLQYWSRRPLVHRLAGC